MDHYQKQTFQKMCYSIYQLSWMLERGISLQDLFDRLQLCTINSAKLNFKTKSVHNHAESTQNDDESAYNNAESVQNDDESAYNNAESMQNNVMMLSNGLVAGRELLLETGIDNGDIWLSYEEFICHQFLDSDYMIGLLSKNAPINNRRQMLKQYEEILQEIRVAC